MFLVFYVQNDFKFYNSKTQNTRFRLLNPNTVKLRFRRMHESNWQWKENFFKNKHLGFFCKPNPFLWRGPSSYENKHILTTFFFGVKPPLRPLLLPSYDPSHASSFFFVWECPGEFSGYRIRNEFSSVFGWKWVFHLFRLYNPNTISSLDFKIQKPNITWCISCFFILSRL